MIKIQMLFDLQVVDLELDKHNQRLLTIATSLHAGSGLTNVYAKVAELKENLRQKPNYIVAVLKILGNLKTFKLM